MAFRNRIPKPRYLLAAAGAVALLAGLSGCDLQENADLDRGQQLFVERCGRCHVLTAAGTNAQIGPDLDFAFKQARADGMDQDTFEGVVQSQIENPRPAKPSETALYMPAGLVEGDDLEAVAAYVASVAGVPGIKAPVFVAEEYFATNCGSCHTLAVAGTTATIGPDLDQVLPGQSAAAILRSITDPGAGISAGFPAGVMPANYGDAISPAQLKALVAYLQKSIGK